ncbi:DUF2726 domain-containing protein [Hydrogenophaga sp.]|uniref:DUF2726 domain-containing protein n=1 Tax=Hydrogenophaga sp. TaxID=1904254 RepID=UPI0035B24A3F
MLPLWIAFMIAVALVAAGVWAYRRYFRRASGREDRYTPERILSPEQVAMLDYLRDTFPDQVVLPNIPLKDMLSVRRSSDHQRARERLQSQKVDFVVCDAEGRAVFAFDVEQYHLSDAKSKAHQIKIKNRILKTAGVRFVFLKNSIHRMPAPNDFRAQLDLAALARPKAQEAEPAESVRQQLESRMSEYDNLIYPSTGFRESEVMGLSGLMGLGDAKAARKADHERQIEAVRRRA